MKKLVSFFMVVILILCCGMLPSVSVFASSVSSEFIYNEITDVDELFRIVAKKESAMTIFSGLSDSTCDTFEYAFKDDALVVKQLLSNTIYTDGSQERNYVENVITVLDENNEIVPFSDSYTEDLVLQNSGADSLGSLIVLTKMYTTVRVVFNDINEYRLRNGSATIIKNNTGNTYHMSVEVGIADVGLLEDSNIGNFTNIVTGQEYIIGSPNSDYMIFTNTSSFMVIATVKDTSNQPVLTVTHRFTDEMYPVIS